MPKLLFLLSFFFLLFSSSCDLRDQRIKKKNPPSIIPFDANNEGANFHVMAAWVAEAYKKLAEENQSGGLDSHQEENDNEKDHEKAQKMIDKLRSITIRATNKICESTCDETADFIISDDKQSITYNSPNFQNIPFVVKIRKIFASLNKLIDDSNNGGGTTPANEFQARDYALEVAEDWPKEVPSIIENRLDPILEKLSSKTKDISVTYQDGEKAENTLNRLADCFQFVFYKNPSPQTKIEIYITNERPDRISYRFNGAILDKVVDERKLYVSEGFNLYQCYLFISANF